MILLQTVPNNIDLKQLRDDVLEVCTKNNIQANIHNLHVWSHTTTRVFGTAHIKLIGKTIEEAQTAFTKVNLKPSIHIQPPRRADRASVFEILINKILIFGVATFNVGILIFRANVKKIGNRIFITLRKYPH